MESTWGAAAFAATGVGITSIDDVSTSAKNRYPRRGSVSIVSMKRAFFCANIRPNDTREARHVWTRGRARQVDSCVIEESPALRLRSRAVSRE